MASIAIPVQHTHRNHEISELTSSFASKSTVSKAQIIANKGIRCYPQALFSTQPDSMQQLLNPPKSQTLVTKNKTYAVTASKQDLEQLDALTKQLKEKVEMVPRFHGKALQDIHLDAFAIFIRILSLLNKMQEQEKLSRRYERELQTKHMERVASNFESQATWTLNTAIGAGVLGILSGVCPMLAHSAAGDKVMEILPDFLKSAGAPKEDLFKSFGKMMGAGSEISKSTGEVQRAKGEAWRTRDHHGQEYAKMLGEELTRVLSEWASSFNNTEGNLSRLLQSDGEVTHSIWR